MMLPVVLAITHILTTYYIFLSGLAVKWLNCDNTLTENIRTWPV